MLRLMAFFPFILLSFFLLTNWYRFDEKLLVQAVQSVLSCFQLFHWIETKRNFCYLRLCWNVSPQELDNSAHLWFNLILQNPFSSFLAQSWGNFPAQVSENWNTQNDEPDWKMYQFLCISLKTPSRLSWFPVLVCFCRCSSAASALMFTRWLWGE